MKTHTNNTNNRGFIDPATLAVLGLGALGVFQWQDHKTNQAQDNAIQYNRQYAAQTRDDLDYLGNYVADKPWETAYKPQPQPAKDGWRTRLTPIGTVEYIKN